MVMVMIMLIVTMNIDTIDHQVLRFLPSGSTLILRQGCRYLSSLHHFGEVLFMRCPENVCREV